MTINTQLVFNMNMKHINQNIHEACI